MKHKAVQPLTSVVLPPNAQIGFKENVTNCVTSSTILSKIALGIESDQNQ